MNTAYKPAQQGSVLPVALIMLVFVFAFRFLESRIAKKHEVGSW